MLDIEKALRDTPPINEEEIFKSLNHQVRRNIIKVLGEKELTFTEIKKGLEPVDSPTLSYHLKSMQELLTQNANKYKLSGIGKAALILLTKTDESIKLSKYRRNFLYAYIVTVVCWTVAETIIPFILSTNVDILIYAYVQIVITAISVVNFITIWQLRKRSF